MSYEFRLPTQKQIEDFRQVILNPTRPPTRDEIDEQLARHNYDDMVLMAVCEPRWSDENKKNKVPKPAIYEIWTEEYINALADYICQKAEDSDHPDYRVLEVGAGDGRLSAYLSAAIAVRQIERNDSDGQKITIIASDSYAEENAKRIVEHNNQYKKSKFTEMGDGYSLTLQEEGGQELKFYASWNGYFERLEDVIVMPISMQGKKSFMKKGY